jgi:tetratricopeptide (TPR) repeat protein
MSMHDDVTPVQPLPPDLLAARFEVFRQDPSDRALFLELRAALRQASLASELAELNELHAPHERSAERAAALWNEAGEARLASGDTAVGERDLRAALRLDPGNHRVARRLADILLTGGRAAEAAQVLEASLLSGGDGLAEPARRAEHHRFLAGLWGDRLGRLDRALYHWQQAWQLEPADTRALDAARTIYASLGDDAMVIRLHEAELQTLGEAAGPERRAAIEFALGQLLRRTGDDQGAAGHLEIALELCPGAPHIREALAETYASPSFAGRPERQRRASELFVELGKGRLATQDQEAGIAYLRRALGADPFSPAGQDVLEAALAEASRWTELDRLYRHRLALVEVESERCELERKRVRLYETELPDRDALKQALAALAASEPPGGDSAYKLRQLYREDEQWAELAALIERDIAALAGAPERMVDELLELSTLAREYLGDRDRAAECLHRVLSIDPRNREALARYAEHFRERRDWRGLADLIEFSFESAEAAGAPVDELAQILEELAQVCESRLGDVERAVATWERHAALQPQSGRAREALRQLTSRTRMWQSLVGVLEQEAQAAQTPRQRADALRRIAQVYRERQVNPRRAIALYEEILHSFPDDEASLKALAELYERDGDELGVAATLRRQLAFDEHRLAAEYTAQGLPVPGPRDWPVARRVERLTALRRLAALCDARPDGDAEHVVQACTGILDILPGDRDALERLERALDRRGDLERLEQTLQYHASAASGPAERAKVLRRLARLAEERGDEPQAGERWQQVLKIAPSDPEALTQLAALCERGQRWAELAEVLERGIAAQPAPEPGSPAAVKRAAELKRHAQVVGERLGDAARATASWRKVLTLLPFDREALNALAALYEAAGDLRHLVEILARQATLHAESDPARATEVALRRAALLETELGAPAEAMAVLEELIGKLAPANLAAHKAVRRLYEARSEFEKAVRVAEREMFLTDSHDEKLARGLEIGILCRDRLNDPARALQAYERVLELDPEQPEALVAAADLHADLGNFRAEAEILARRLGQCHDPAERGALMLRIARVTAVQLDAPREAFSWYRRAYLERPGPETLEELRRAARQHGLWQELAEVHENDRAALRPGGAAPAQPEPYVATCREIAGIAERRLGDRERALRTLLDALTVQPDNPELIADARRIAEEGDTEPLWRLLLSCLEVLLTEAARSGPVPRRVELHLERARLLEVHLGEGAAAAGELLRAFARAPHDRSVQEAVHALAGRTGQWEHALAVDAALLGLLSELPQKLAIQRRRARILEEQTGALARAFRAHLLAFSWDPDDAETRTQLWRLGRLIGRYHPEDRSPAAEPAPAPIDAPSSPPARRARPTDGAALIAATRPRRAPTEEISASQVRIETEQAPADPTVQLDLADLIIEERRQRSEPTIELRSEDLAQLTTDLVRARPGRRTRPPPTPLPRRNRPTTLPPLPPVRRPAQPVLARSDSPRPLPGAPVRTYESPWHEWAARCEELPAVDLSARLHWLFFAAEIWESGAADLERAFATLARCLELAPGSSEPPARLHRLAAEHDAWDRLAALYQKAADEAATAEDAVRLLSAVAAIRLQQGQEREAEVLYRRVLGIRPDEVAARQALETLFRSQGRWVDLAASIEERADPRLSSATSEAERPALLRELAHLYADELGRSHDAIDALERLRKLAPENLEVVSRLGELYRAIGRWSSVIEMLSRVRDIAEGSAEARSALRQIAQIYETELELPDRAVDAYAALVAQWPEDADAWCALDRLYVDLGRWTELDEVLRRRAGMAREPAERGALLRRRGALLLERLDAPQEAAAALRHAHSLLPDDLEIADELVLALSVAGRAREAIALLEERITSARQRPGAAGDVAALLIRLASLRDGGLGDRNGARAALEQALALVPHHPTAIAALARMTRDEDPRAYAEARLREAAALTDVDARIEALLAAAEVLRDQCADPEAARRAFEAALRVQPAHAEATWALAGLVEQGGDLMAAAHLLESQLAGPTLAAEERVRLLTQLAALARQAGVPEAAEHRLAEALRLLPAHLPAVIARADLLHETGRHGELETFLQDTLPRLADAPPAARADLYRRLAGAFEKLGRDDEAYQTLLEAERLHRGDLLIKLALGENRYRARRWREAALYLGALAEHPEAQHHPRDVAAGLYHAALAEIRSLRPDKAPALYEQALTFQPDYAPALHALAELAMERGEPRRAIELLERQAGAAAEPGERCRLYTALGDLVLRLTGDEAHTQRCYEAALAAADPLEARHLPLLDKLLTRQQARGDLRGAARTTELLASFAADVDEQTARLLAAAGSYLDAGDLPRARASAERACAQKPHSPEALAMVARTALADGDADGAARVLSRALAGRAGEAAGAERDPAQAHGAARLWELLGRAQLARGERDRAAEALQAAIAAAPRSPEALAARRALLELWRDAPDHHQEVVEYHRFIADSSRDPADLAAYGRTLLRLGDPDGARAILCLAAALGAVLDAAAETELLAQPPPALDADHRYRDQLGADEHEALIAHCDPHLARFLALLWQAAPLLWSDPQAALERCGVTSARRHTGAGGQAQILYSHIAKALGTPATVLYTRDEEEAPPVQVVCVSPPLIVVGPALLRSAAQDSATPVRLGDTEQRFLLARAAELSRPEHIVAAGLPPAEFAELLARCARLFGGTGEPDPLDETLRQTLPVRLRQALQEAWPAAARAAAAPEAYLAACHCAADRAGLVACGDVAAALRLARPGGELARHPLTSTVLAHGYLPLRARLGIDRHA